ncbi:MAG: SLBB domain-containing protein [Bacteroidota bacterium]
MDRYIAFSKIFILGVLFIALQGVLHAQNQTALEEILKKYNINPTEIPAENLSQIEARVQSLQEAGSTEEEIIATLRSEELIPDNAVADSSQTIIPVNPLIKDSAQTPTEDSVIVKPLPKPEVVETENVNQIFGHGIFKDTTGAFVRAIPTTPPANYVIGAGDAFNVTIWGCNELSESLVVEDDGSIYRPYLGKVYLAGLPYEQAQRILMDKYRGPFPSCSKIEIFMGRSKRTITVNITGEVERPGAYVINAATPAFNALFEAGGVTEKGSVRNIAIKRNGKTVQIVDIYEYLIGGEDQPVFLQNNDFLFIPVQDKLVRISGAVEREGLYELREDEQLKSLVLFSGGLSFFARTERARIDRFELGEKNVFTFELGKYLGTNTPDYPLVEGDEVFIRSQNLRLRNYVGVRGSVRFPDTYQFQAGDRVSDLIDRSGGLEEDALLGQAYIMRSQIGTYNLRYIPIEMSQVVAKNPAADIPLQNRDILYVFSNESLGDKPMIAIGGEVRNPGVFENASDLNLKTLLYLANGPKSSANVHNIELMLVPDIADLHPTKIKPHIDQYDPSAESYRKKVQYSLRVSIGENWQNNSQLDSIFLLPFNRIHIYDKYEFMQFEEVSIEGSVNAPGSYRLMEGMDLKDLIYQAKGVTAGSDRFEVELHSKVAISEKGLYGTKPTDKEIVRFTIDRNWESEEALENVPLEGIERVILISENIFAENTYIQIKGEVRNPGQYQLVPNMTLKDLIYQAGGLKLIADFDNIELTRIIEKEEDGNIIPTPIVQQTISVNQDWQNDPSLAEVEINAFDQIFVRKNPDLEIQESVFLDGEIVSPGEYNKIRKFERISSLVKRANGPTDLADIEGAQIFREGINGPISLKLKRALANPGGKFDIPLLAGDRLLIPPLQNTVTISGNVLKPGITVIYEKGYQIYLLGLLALF